MAGDTDQDAAMNHILAGGRAIKAQLQHLQLSLDLLIDILPFPDPQPGQILASAPFGKLIITQALFLYIDLFPQFQPAQKIRFLVLPQAKLLIRLLAVFLRVITRILHR